MTKVLWEKFQMDNVLGLRNSVLVGQNLAKSIRSDIGSRKFLFSLMKETLINRTCSYKLGNQSRYPYNTKQGFSNKQFDRYVYLLIHARAFRTHNL